MPSSMKNGFCGARARPGADLPRAWTRAAPVAPRLARRRDAALILPDLPVGRITRRSEELAPVP